MTDSITISHMCTNPPVSWTACKLRLQVPFALRAPAAGYLAR